MPAEAKGFDLTPRPQDLEPIEIASRDEIAALQLQRLNWSLDHAYENVPLYRRTFDAAGVHPDDLRQLEDLAKFPFTTKEDLRDNYPFGMFAVPREKIVRIHASSGTTGKPTVVGYTARRYRHLGRPRARARSAPPAGGPGMRARRLWLRPVHRRPRRALRRREARLHGRPDVRRHDRAAGAADPRFRARHHHGDAVLHAGDPRRVPPPGHRSARDARSRSAFSAPSPGPTPCAARSRRRFDMHAVDIYGLSEVMGPGVANECVETKDGLHIWEDHFYPEIIDPETGAVLPDGEQGELVFTSLTKEAMPVDPLPHARPHAAVARHGAHDAAHGEDHRPLRRHDYPARRQRVPDPDRGADPRDRAASRRISSSSCAATAGSTRWRSWSRVAQARPTQAASNAIKTSRSASRI